MTDTPTLSSRLKPAVLSTLEGIADGYVEIEFDEGRRNAFLKDWPSRAIVPGVFTLIEMGYLTGDAKITEAGRLALLAATQKE